MRQKIHQINLAVLLVAILYCLSNTEVLGEKKTTHCINYVMAKAGCLSSRWWVTYGTD